MKSACALLLLLLQGVGFSQPALDQHVSDSLLKVWNDPAQPDTLRLQALYDYAWEGYLFTKPDSCYYYCNEMLAFAEAGGHKKHMSVAHYAMGISSFYVGENRRAIRHFLIGLAQSEEVGYTRGMYNNMGGLGTVYGEQGDYGNAIKYYTISLELATSEGSKSGMASVMNNLAAVYQNQGDYAVSMGYFAKSYKLYEEIGSKRGMANVTNNIGSIYLEQGDHNKALDYFTQSLRIKEELGEKKGIARTTLNIGVTYFRLREFEKAGTYFDQCIALQKEVGDLHALAAALFGVGLNFRDQGNYDAAIPHLIEAAGIQQQLGALDEWSGTLNAIGNTYRLQNKPDLAIRYCSSAFGIAQKIGSRNLMIDCSRSLYIAYSAINKTDSALYFLSLLRATLTEALAINYFTLSEREKEIYFATILESDFGHYYDFTLAHNEKFPGLSDTAYNLALQNKGLALKSSAAMRTALLQSGDTALIADYEKWLELKRKIADLYSSGEIIDELEAQANDLEKELVGRSAAFSDFDKLKQLSWQQVQSALAKHECAIEFIHFKSSIDSAHPGLYCALILKPGAGHPEMVRLCTEDELAGILGKFQGNNLAYINEVYGTSGGSQKLYSKIWAPIEPHLNGVKTIYFSPAGLLHKVSFAALSPSRGVFLSDRYRFRRLGSTGSIVIDRDKPFSNKESFFVMGGVKYSTEKTTRNVWSYLPGSLEETESINAFLTSKNYAVKYFSAEQATEDMFKQQTNASVIHIATHGFFFPDPAEMAAFGDEATETGEIKFRGAAVNLPDGRSNYADWSFVNNTNPLMRSGIVLAAANDVWTREPLDRGEDGVLTAQEVSTLNLRNTKLVVLSACETGLGDIRGSEGVFGLQRAFKMAGVKHLIMSLWQVPDKETAEFMQLFYKNLVKLKDIPIAFQKTQETMRKKYDPYYWGAFVLIE